MQFYPSPEHHSTNYMYDTENDKIGSIIKIGHLTLKITHVAFIKRFKKWTISVYESWGTDHAPMTTCGHNMTLRKYDNEKWSFMGCEYYDEYITEEVAKELDEILTHGCLVMDNNFSCSWAIMPRTLVKP